jgi:hypothetical protein
VVKSTLDLEADIVRLYYAEHWPVGTIATQLETHVDVVRRVLGLDAPRAPSLLRPRIIDPYRPFIDDKLQRRLETDPRRGAFMTHACVAAGAVAALW